VSLEAESVEVWRMRPFLIFLFCLALYFGMLSILAMVAGAVSLEITGQASGQGAHLLNFTGEQLNASLWQNGSAWNLSIRGLA
jgi:hypothetical protein